MEKDRPIFSVIIPFYNRASLVIELIGELSHQEFKDYEIILINDGSDDNAESLIKSLIRPNLLYWYQNNAGVSAARNLGAKHARGEYVIFLDSDDFPYRNWLLEFSLIAKSKADLIFCGYDFFQENAKIKSYVDFEENEFLYGLKGKFLAGIFAVKKEIFNGVGGYNNKLGYSENLELGLRIAAYVKIHEGSNITIKKNIIRINRPRNSRERWNAYLQKIAYSTLYILKNHGDVFKKNPKIKLVYLSILGRTFFKLKNYHRSFTIYRLLISKKPYILRFWGFYFLSAIRRLR